MDQKKEENSAVNQFIIVGENIVTKFINNINNPETGSR